MGAVERTATAENWSLNVSYHIESGSRDGVCQQGGVVNPAAANDGITDDNNHGRVRDQHSSELHEDVSHLGSEIVLSEAVLLGIVRASTQL
jgi:hypothetical protein